MTGQWKAFIEHLEGEMKSVLGTSSAEYRKLSENWLRLSEAMNSNLAGAVGGEGGKGGAPWQAIYDQWVEGSRTIKKNMESTLDSEDPNHKKLFQTWEDESQKFGESLSDRMLSGMKEQMELYELWMDAFGRDRGEMDHFDEVGGIVGRHYSDFMDRLQRINSEARDDRGAGGADAPSFDDVAASRATKDIYEAWLATTSSMMKDIMATPTFGGTLRQSADAYLKAKESTDRMMEDELRRMRLPTMSQMDELYKGLIELDRKVNAIQEMLEEGGPAPTSRAGGAGAPPTPKRAAAPGKTAPKKKPAGKKAAPKKKPVKKKAAPRKKASPKKPSAKRKD